MLDERWYRWQHAYRQLCPLTSPRHLSAWILVPRALGVRPIRRHLSLVEHLSFEESADRLAPTGRLLLLCF